MLLHLSRQFGPVYVMRGKMPTFPDTYAGAGGMGLEVMPEAQTQYWSLVSCEAAPSGQIVDGLTDMQVPLDADRHYTIVYSRKEDRPANATPEHGVAWIEWSPRGEGHRRAEEPRRLRHADVAHHGDESQLEGAARRRHQTRHGRSRHGALLPQGLLHHHGGVRGRGGARIDPRRRVPSRRAPGSPTRTTRASNPNPMTRNMAATRIMRLEIRMTSAIETPTHRFTNTRDLRYGEVFLVTDEGIDMYNTTGLNDCLEQLWNALDPAKLQEDFKVHKVLLNSTHWWVMDTLSVQLGETLDFHGLQARWIGRLPIAMAQSSHGFDPYEVFEPKKAGVMESRRASWSTSSCHQAATRSPCRLTDASSTTRLTLQNLETLGGAPETRTWMEIPRPSRRRRPEAVPR